MAKKRARTIGYELEEQFFEAIRDADRVLPSGARNLPVLIGLMPHGSFTIPQESVLVRAADFLRGSGRVYIYGSTIVLEIRQADGDGSQLAPLRSGSAVEVGAEDFLANILVCQYGDKQFAVPKWFADVLLRSELLVPILPHIRHYATRPVFDQHFVLRGPGWHPEVGILVHGPAIEPVTLDEQHDLTAPAVQRLPPHLQALLSGFCFSTDADVANTIALMLTGTLMNHFVAGGKPIGLIDGNQRDLGKTLLIRAIGMVLDGIDPQLIHFTPDDEELQKRMCATLRDSCQSVLIIDNAKLKVGSVVSSPAIESNSMAPAISLRILGRSHNFTRPNDVIWALTMNNTRTSPDLVSRGIPIQMSYEGKTEERTFVVAKPVDYALAHRLEILGELAGMVVAWNQAGRLRGTRGHRLHEWAAIIGGILETAGLPEFLTNAATAAASFNVELEELAALAEAVIQGGGPYIDHEHPNKGD